jgi:MFS transporter, DHA1 family, tetracycline resistance protein
LVISFSELIHDSGSHLIWSFWSLYVLKLGGGVEVLGLFTLITGILSIILHPILGYISDKIGRKKPVVIGGFIISFFPLMMALADSWVWLIPGVLLRAVDNGLWITRQALFTDNIESDKKGRSLATFYTIMSFTASFLPTFGGLLLDSMGTTQGFRIGLYFSFVTHLIQSTINAKYLIEPDSPSKSNNLQKGAISQFLGELIKSIRGNRKFQTILLGQGILSFSQGLISQFTIIYAIQIVGLSKTQWGLISSASSFANLLLRIPIGSMVDRIGNIRGYIVGIGIQSLYPILFYSSGLFFAIMFCNIINSLGSTFTQMGREALLVEIMPRDERGIMLGSFAAISNQGGLFGSISPSLGAFVWDSYGPVYNFYLASILGGFSALYYFRNYRGLKENPT